MEVIGNDEEVGREGSSPPKEEEGRKKNRTMPRKRISEVARIHPRSAKTLVRGGISVGYPSMRARKRCVFPFPAHTV